MIKTGMAVVAVTAATTAVVASPPLDWNLVIVAVIAAFPPTIVAAVGVWQVFKTHSLVNSRMTELLDISKKSAADAATLKEKQVQEDRKEIAAIETAIEAAAKVSRKK